MATFTDIVRKQRAKGEGIGSSLATAFSERARERLDPRNYLFNRKGTLAALFPSLKGYQSKTGAEKLKGGGSEGLSAGAEAILNTVADRLGELKTQFRMVAKNSIVLPQMARDTNITRQNIQKLVKMQGGEASNKADMFFKRAGERESQYESAMKAGKPTPAKEVKKEEKSGGFLQKIFGFLLAPITLLVKLFSSILGTLTGGLKKLSEVIGSILSLASTAGLIKTATDVAKGAVGVGRGLAAAAAGTGALVANAAGKVFGGPKSPSGGIATKGKPLTDFGTVGQSREAVKNKSLWARFLAFVERKSPKLFARVFAKLAAAGGLAAIPGPGWILSAVELGLAAWTMYELYELWKEFNGLPAEQNTLSPEQKDSLTTIAPQQSTTPTTAPMSGREKGRNLEEQRKAQRAGVGAGPDVDTSKQLVGATLKSPEELLKAISRGESGGNYNIANLGERSGYVPKVIDGLTEMTLDEILQKQKNKEFLAVGKYQFTNQDGKKGEPGTLRRTMKNAGVKGTDKFDAATQEKLGRTLLDEAIKKGGNNPVAQQRALAYEFAAVALPETNKTAYPGKGNNKATVFGKDLFTGPNLSAAPPAAPAAVTDLPMPLSSASNNEYDPERIKAIANYRVGIPPKLTADGKGAGITVNNVDSSKKVVQGGSGSSMAAGTVYNSDMAILLLDRTIADRMFA